MAKILVFQHVSAEPLGTLDPMLRQRGHRIRYVNFHRHPDAEPDVSRYDAPLGEARSRHVLPSR